MNIEWWRRFIDLHSIESIERNRKALVLYSISYIGCAVMFWFAYVSIGYDKTLFFVILLSSCIILINAILSHFIISLGLAVYVACFSIFILIIGLAYTGGHDSTALYWMFPFPIVFFLLLNYKVGLILNITLFSIVFFIINSPQYNIADYSYDTNIRFEVAIVLTIFFSFLSELVRSQSHRDLVSLNIEKQRLAHTDQLTSLPNRHFLEQLDSSTYSSLKFPLAVVMADIDFFKSVNDRYGHSVGDNVLQYLAVFLKDHIRGSDIVIRMGGEEFLLLFPATDTATAITICNKLNSRLRNSPYRHENGDIVITLSFGVALAQSSNKIEMAIKQADKLLYLAKKNGRSRVETTTCTEELAL